MNLLGKIFTFAILVASIVVLVVAVAVYGTHKNWQTAHANLQTQYDKAMADNQDLEAKYLAQVSQLKSEQEAALQDVAKLETERDQLQAQNQAFQAQVDQLREAERANVALVRATEENNNRLTEEVAQLRTSILEHQQARDDAFRSVLEATTELHTTAGQLQQLQERNAQVVADLADKTRRLTDGAGATGEYVPNVRGKVSSTRRDAGRQLIEITIGADDGLQKNHTVEIFRGARYLGRAVITDTEPDRAVGEIQRQFQQGQIQEGDDVATRLRVG